MLLRKQLGLGRAKINLMSIEMEKAYEPQKHESAIYKRWEESGAFEPNDSDKEPFSIIMPPPNANGDLHLGHAMYTVEDIMIRYQRMQGRPVLWLPGADHAGIETQVVYERELAKAGKTRLDLGREEFYKQALAFTTKNMATMQNQIRKLGFSADWSRFKFTLDEDIVQTVYETFRKLHEDGLIYRGNRIVNWCPSCRSGFADIEIKYREQIDPLYYIKYGPFVLATVRPETKFGDTAIAVHPKDERYKQYIGKEVEADGLLGKFKLKVIADEYVNPEFGTGVIKVTPAHDPNDWEIGQRHGLEVKQTIGTDGLLTEMAGKYAGMPVDQAREQVAHDLEEHGLMDHVEMDYKHSVAYHDRCGTAIEPLVTEQWWLKVEPLVAPAIKAAEDGTIKIIPSRFKKPYTEWLANLRDWNIGRQNWFGIRIPAYYNTSSDTTKEPYIVALTEAEAENYYGAGNYEPESDTFDTWFSSSQWPFATLKATGDFDRYYPTSVMETGRDILFQWVTRMVMLGLYRTGEVPFKTVYLHGLIQDEHGKKMSKSKGNVINPLEMTEKYGTDAVRLALTIGITPGNDGALSEQKIEGYRNFCNKLWNVARFILSQLPADYSPTTPVARNEADDWMLSRLTQETTIMTRAIDSYDFSEAGQAVYSLLWDDFADWYIEASKVELNLDLLVYGLETILKLSHPFAPFVTEAIWQKMAWQSQDLIVSPWPQPLSISGKGIEFQNIQAVVSEIRSIKADLGDQGKRAYSGTPNKFVEKLSRVEHTPEVAQGIMIGTYKLAINPEEHQALRAKRQKRIDELAQGVKSLEQKLANLAFKSKAPALWNSEKDRLTTLRAELEQQRENLRKLG